MLEKWIIKLLPLILTTLTPSLKQAIEKFISDFKTQATRTANPWDDFAAELLEQLLIPKK